MTDSPAATLRRAASLMRERAEAAKSACHTDWGNRPWAVEHCVGRDQETDEPGCACIVYQGEYKPFDQPQVPLIQYVADAETEEHAFWIASMHPLVGLALADWLEAEAEAFEAYESGTLDKALVVVRAYLNGGGNG